MKTGYNEALVLEAFVLLAGVADSIDDPEWRTKYVDWVVGATVVITHIGTRLIVEEAETRLEYCNRLKTPPTIAKKPRRCNKKPPAAGDAQ